MPKNPKGWDKIGKRVRNRRLLVDLIMGAIVVSMWYYIITKFLDAI